MALVLSLLLFSAICWAIVIWGLGKRSKDSTTREKAKDHRRSAEIYSLARERWRRSRKARQNGKSKSR